LSVAQSYQQKDHFVTSPVIDFLLNRKSVPISAIGEPAPTDEEIETILRAAVRVPDHGRLTPWRFIIYRGDARREIGEKLAALADKREGPLPDQRLEQERNRLSRAPLVICVISRPVEHPRIPEWEMFLSAGTAAFNLVLAANALGYATNWVTNWFSSDPEGRRILGLAPNERVVGLVHIGSFDGDVPERPRPDPKDLTSNYTGPYSGPDEDEL
jgi:nitroreductase